MFFSFFLCFTQATRGQEVWASQQSWGRCFNMGVFVTYQNTIMSFISASTIIFGVTPRFHAVNKCLPGVSCLPTGDSGRKNNRGDDFAPSIGRWANLGQPRSTNPHPLVSAGWRRVTDRSKVHHHPTKQHRSELSIVTLVWDSWKRFSISVRDKSSQAFDFYLLRYFDPSTQQLCWNQRKKMKTHFDSISNWFFSFSQSLWAQHRNRLGPGMTFFQNSRWKPHWQKYLYLTEGATLLYLQAKIQFVLELFDLASFALS